MKTGDWLKLSIFALVGVVISLVILGFNSNTRNATRNAYSNNLNMQGYANTGYYPDNQPKARQISQKNDFRNTMQMQGENGTSSINGTTMDYSQTGYLPSQLMAMNYQMINNDRYLQSEITSIKQHGARLNNEVQELQSQYGQLKQGLSNVYTTLNGLNQNNPAQNAGMSYGGKGMQMNGSGYDATAHQYQQTGMGMNGMGAMNPVQNQYGMGYNTNTPNQYQPTGMNGTNQMSQPGTNGMNSMQNSGMNMGMGTMDNMMMNMMNMMDKMMMMNGMQNSGNGMSSGNSGSGGSMSSGGGMGMM